MTRISAPRLVLVTNRSQATMPLPELAVRAIAGGVDLVQIRAKDLSEAELERLVISIMDEVDDPARVQVNGSHPVADRLGIGLHVPEDARSTFSGDVAGLLSTSVHDVGAVTTLAEFAFLIAGHVYETASKAGKAPLGPDGIRAIAHATPLPVIAIGGITPARTVDIMSTGVHGVAVMAGINAAADPESAARAYRVAIDEFIAAAATPISVTVNGKPAALPSRMNVQAFLKEVNQHERMVVVELNGIIIRRAGFETTMIENGAEIEIVHFVGGG